MTAAATPRLPGWLALLGVLMAVAPLSIDMYLPGFPAVARDFGVGPGAVQLTLASFFVGIALGQLAYGPLSDRFGRKPPLYFGFTLYGLASLGCALAPGIGALVGWRLVQALGGCAGMVISRAVVRDRCDPVAAARAFSLLMLVMGVAPILAPLGGGLLIAWLGWRAVFAVLALFALACLLGIHYALPESLDPRQAHPLAARRVLRHYGELCRDRHFLSHTLCGGLASAGMFAYITGSPFVIIQYYGVPATRFGWIFGANALGLIACSQINGRLLRHHAPGKLLRGALWLPALAGGLLLGCAALGHPPLPLLLAGLFCFIASIGFIAPNASALALQHQGHRAGMAAALMGSLQFLLATLAGVAMGSWHSTTLWPLCTLMATCGAGALGLHRATAT